MIRRAVRNSAAVSELEELIRSYIIRSTMLICCLLLCTRPFGSRFCLGGWGARRTQLERLEPHPAGGALFDHLVSLGEHQNWDLKAEGVSGLEIDHQFYLGALLDWEVSRLGAVENLSDVNTCLLV